jgi:hypothetical protein
MPPCGPPQVACGLCALMLRLSWAPGAALQVGTPAAPHPRAWPTHRTSEVTPTHPPPPTRGAAPPHPTLPHQGHPAPPGGLPHPASEATTTHAAAVAPFLDRAAAPFPSI